MSIRVFVVDDSDVFIDAVREVLDACSEFELVGSTHTGEAALTRAADALPDIVLIDVRLPGMDGVATWRALSRLRPQARFVLCSVGDDPRKVEDTDFERAAFVPKASISPRTLRAAWQTRAQAAS